MASKKVKIDMEKAMIPEKLKVYIEEKNVDVFTSTVEWKNGKEYPYTFIFLSLEDLNELNRTPRPIFGFKEGGSFTVPFRIRREFLTPLE